MPLAGKLEANRPINKQTKEVPPLLKFVISRPGAILMLLLLIGISIYNWNSLIAHRYYYPKMAFLAPLGILLFLVGAVSPGFIHRPRDARYKVQIWILVTVGLALGALNFYLMGWVY